MKSEEQRENVLIVPATYFILFVLFLPQSLTKVVTPYHQDKPYGFKISLMVVILQPVQCIVSLFAGGCGLAARDFKVAMNNSLVVVYNM